MLLPLFKDDDAFDLLMFFISDLRNGRLPRELKPYLLGATLLALAKEDSTKPMQVAVGECLYNLVTNLAISQLKDQVTKVLAPV